MALGNESILVVDDDLDILTAAKYLLERHYRTVVTCSDPNQIPQLLQQNEFDVILLDMNFQPGASDGEMGLKWLEEIRRIDPQMVVVMITAHGSVNVAVEAMKRGAIDYLNKPWDNDRLLATLSSALQLSHTRTKAAQLEQTNQALNKAAGQQRSSIIGNSTVMQNLFTMIGRAAPTDANVLILGENGTGKELVAREIHRQSNRQDQVLIPVDLGSIAETLFESELFGHIKGAFTGAKENRIGYLEAANGGSLFLDEIGNLPVHLQAKLLSVLEKREVVQVGSSKPRGIDVRIIAATNMPMEELTDPKFFRQDLLFRLNTVEILLPPLHERASDIPEIANHYVEFYCTKYGKPKKIITEDAMAAMKSYKWPGNVRALRHAIERAVILSEKDKLDAEDFQLPSQSKYPANENLVRKNILEGGHEKNNEGASAYLKDEEKGGEEELNLEKLEQRTVMHALKKNNYVISHTAKDLGLTRAALYRRMEKYGI